MDCAVRRSDFFVTFFNGAGHPEKSKSKKNHKVFFFHVFKSVCPALSADKTKINGLNLRGSPADVEAIWEWLDIRRDGQFKIIDQDNPTRIALENEILYLVRTPYPSRDIKLEWDPTLSGTLTNTVNTGQHLTQKSLGSTEAVYTSVIQTGLPHKSTFAKDGRNVKVHIVTADKQEMGLSLEMDITKYTKTMATSLEKYFGINRVRDKYNLDKSDNNISFFLDGKPLNLEISNEEEENTRFAYRKNENKNEIEAGINAKGKIRIGAGLNYKASKFGCNWEVTGGVFLKPSANLTGKIGINNSIVTYINNEKPATSKGFSADGSLELGVEVSIGPEATINLCNSAEVGFEGTIGASMAFLKVAPPEND